MNAQAGTIATMPTQNEERRVAANSWLKKRFHSLAIFEQLRFKGGKLVRYQEFVHAINGVNLDIKRGEAPAWWVNWLRKSTVRARSWG